MSEFPTPEIPPHEVYVLDRLTIQHLHTILTMLAYEGEITIKLNRNLPTQPLEDWHQIELAIIAQHERRVRGLNSVQF